MSRAARDPRHLVAPLIAGIATFTLYARTLPPGLTWANSGADGGDLLAAALTGGVPHPTGYPTYQILLRLAVKIIGGEPARAGAWLSALGGALAVAILADLAQSMLRQGEKKGWAGPATAALIGALAWGASTGLWGQATIVEVYALNTLTCVSLLWLSWRWSEAVETGARTWPWLLAFGLVLGLGLGNHLTVVLVLPGIALWYWTRTRGRRVDAKGVAWAVGGLLAGLALYAYLPLAARGSSPVNWGNPVTLQNLAWVVTGRLYAGLAFGLPPARLPERLLAWATWTVGQFFPWGLLLALAGLARLERRLRDWWLATLLIWLAFSVYAIGYNTNDSIVYLIPAFAVMALWLSQGLDFVFDFVAERAGSRAAAAFAGVAVLALLALPVVSAASQWTSQDLSKEGQARTFLASALAEAEPDAVILSAGDERTFALWYGVYGLGQRPDVSLLNVNLYGFEWYRRALAKRDPGLLPSSGELPPLETLVRTLATQRPVYAAEDVGLDLPLDITGPEDVLTRVQAPAQ
jgi:4-amino-4-deoxy-L-arabinose transferase-like glycosyltransferase